MNITIKILLIMVTLLTSACADLSYYLHSAKGQWSIMQQTRDIDDVLQDQSTHHKIREKLQLVGDIRHFAFTQIQLPESDSYTQYADLGRRYVLKNLFASEEFSTSLHRWCYPVVGCTGYRGYFDNELLEKYKSNLVQQGMDVYVASIPAYSTLGWFDDPVLNTFIHWPEYRLAGLIFHELAHQRLYIDDDSQFNESFAMAVQQTAVEKWLQDRHQYKQLISYKQYLQNRQTVIQMIEKARESLSLIYEKDLTESDKRLKKHQILDKLKQDYHLYSSKHDVKDGFTHWFKGELNNAKLASISTYHSNVGAFRNILKYVEGNYSDYFELVEKISKLPKIKRHYCLELWDRQPVTTEKCH